MKLLCCLFFISWVYAEDSLKTAPCFQSFHQKAIDNQKLHQEALQETRPKTVVLHTEGGGALVAHTNLDNHFTPKIRPHEGAILYLIEKLPGTRYDDIVNQAYKVVGNVLKRVRKTYPQTTAEDVKVQIENSLRSNRLCKQNGKPISPVKIKKVLVEDLIASKTGEPSVESINVDLYDFKSSALKGKTSSEAATGTGK